MRPFAGTAALWGCGSSAGSGSETGVGSAGSAGAALWGSRTRVGSSGTISAGVVSGTGAGAADAFSCSYTGSSSGVSKVSSNSSSYKSTALLSCSLQRAICTLQEGSAAHRPAEQRSVSFLRSSPVLRRARRGVQMGFDKIPLNNIAQFAEKRKWKLLTFPRSFHFFTVSSYSRRAVRAVSTSAERPAAPADP